MRILSDREVRFVSGGESCSEHDRELELEIVGYVGYCTIAVAVGLLIYAFVTRKPEAIGGIAPLITYEMLYGHK
jgi:hypothetical protein